MLRRSQRVLVRRKHGQKAWSPNSTSSGGAPTNGVTAQEALQIAYRPMPPAQTVEYEEDFGPSMIIHREFLSNKHRTRMAANIAQLAYSDVELTKSRQQLANVMNRERRGVVVGAGGEEADRVFFNSDVDDTTREVKSARYLFNEPRMLFCDRFQNFFRERIERQRQQVQGGSGSGATATDTGDDQHYYFSLMEACAVLHGCETTEAREAYYRRFLGLNLDALETEAAALQARAADAAALDAHLASSPRAGAETAADGSGENREAALLAATQAKALAGEKSRSASGESAEPLKSPMEVVQDLIDAMPPLFPTYSADVAASSSSPVTSTATKPAEATPSAAPLSSGSTPPIASPLASVPPTLTATSKDDDDRHHLHGSASSLSPTHVSEDVAPLYRAYLAHARGESPVASYDVTTIGAHAAHAERRRWRSLMDKIAAEDYHHLTPAELEDAYVLNQQLHTVKFFDLKVGDTVREIMQLLQRGTGAGSSADRDTPLGSSPSHPERRV